MFPVQRPRRLRNNNVIRKMVREHVISPDDLIYPLFVTFGKGVKKEISSMPNCYQESVDEVTRSAKDVHSLGIPSILLFGIPEHKDDVGSEGYADDGVVQQAVRAIKDAVPDLYVITDVCMCEYTSHGHCGIIRDGDVLNDATLELLQKEALSHARAGADMVAPSDMMDGRVAAIRDPEFGDRRSYQMDPPNRREALKEVELDVEEGADIVMVKPALSYLDVISDVRDSFDLPVAAYNVSGEYSLVHAAARMDWIDYDRVMMEILVSIKRAGADLIITYHAKDAAKILNI
jgi:porphobilinogen synthase